MVTFYCDYSCMIDWRWYDCVSQTVWNEGQTKNEAVDCMFMWCRSLTCSSEENMIDYVLLQL